VSTVLSARLALTDCRMLADALFHAARVRSPVRDAVLLNPFHSRAMDDAKDEASSSGCVGMEATDEAADWSNC
jgi:hypothetical protein